MQTLKERLSEWIFDAETFNNQSIFLVGGCVRDILLKRSSQDIDLACFNARQFANDLANEKNAVCVVMDKKPQVPCFRLVNRKSPQNYIDITEIRDETIESDLKKRDFTINAMAIPLTSGLLDTNNIIDVVDGKKDLEQKLICQVGKEAFTDDPLRMLRAFRFSAQLDFSIDSNTMKAIQLHAEKIKTMSAERILFELKLLLRHSNVSRHIEKMDQTGILSALFPEIDALRLCEQNAYHHTHVWGHSLEALKAYELLLTELHTHFKSTNDQVSSFLNQNDNMAIIKLACLFHDIAKPDTQKVDPETNRITFYSHDQLGKKQIEKLCDRLRLSKKNSAFLCTLVEEHLHIRDLLKENTRHKTVLKNIRKIGENIIAVTLLSIADKQATCGTQSTPEDQQEYFEKAVQFIESYYNDIQPVICRKNLITGKDLMKNGIEPGPTMGKILRLVREAQDEGTISSHDQAMAMIKKLIKNDI
ncbi:polynucleotide adenylyltransferase/metal dependent phosphohydrolase [Candidatus Magnetomorum sp. HK-1]|nr:polynucleotide adenylyltransferase/metal dependent phosphohydrolase [Candidatus Magnetomorum sp. HK-1]